VSYDEDGTLVISTRLPAEEGAVVLAALGQARAAIDHERRRATESSAEDSPPSATLAEGLVHMAELALARMAVERPEAVRRGRSRLTAYIDPLSGWGRLPDGEFLPPDVVHALADQLPGQDTLRPLTAEDLTRHDLGRTRRLPSLALRELVGTLDGERCRFPGCTRHRKLQAHHVLSWEGNGPTDLANLLLLCSRHHTLVHAQGFQLHLDGDRRLTVTTVKGVSVLHHPGLPWRSAEELDREADIQPTTLPPTVNGDRLDLGYAVAVLLQQAA